MKHERLALLLVLMSSHVAASGTCSQNSCTGKLSLLYPHGGNGKIYVQSMGDMSSLTCTLDQGSIVLKQSNLLYHEIYTLLVSAMMTDREIKLRVADSATCDLMYVSVGP